MLSFLKRRAFITAVGLLLISLFIWYAGPYFAFADRQPLESSTARLIAIALVVAIWGALVLLRRQPRPGREPISAEAGSTGQAERL